MDYDYRYENGQLDSAKPSNGWGIASMICGIFCLVTCINPLYLISSIAIILGIISLCKKGSSKAFGITGIVCGSVSTIFCVIIDIILFPFTLGASLLF